MNTDGSSHTLYVQNINDKIKPDNLKKSLYLLFSTVGEVIDIHQHLKAKFRGQAWVVFKTSKDANRAKSLLDGTAFYGKPLKIVESKNKSDIISKADGTYASRAQSKINQLQETLQDSMESSDGVKRKLDHSSIETNAEGIKRSTTASNLPQCDFSISTEPTSIILATNFPPSVHFDAVQKFFESPQPLSIQSLQPYNSIPLLQSLSLPTNQIVYKIELSNDKDAQKTYEKHNRFKIDDQHRLKLTYLIDLTKLQKDEESTSITSNNDPNSTVSLASGGEVTQ